MRPFQPAYKALRSNAAGWNVGEGGVGVKRPSRPNPEPPTGGEAHTDLLGAGFLFFIFYSKSSNIDQSIFRLFIYFPAVPTIILSIGSGVSI